MPKVVWKLIFKAYFTDDELTEDEQDFLERYWNVMDKQEKSYYIKINEIFYKELREKKLY